MSYGNSALLDTVTRTYKNSGSEVIAVQTLSVIARTICTVDATGRSLSDPRSLNTDRFLRTATVDVVTEKRFITGSRVVDSVITEGSFDSQTISGSDITSITYTGIAPVNDITLGLEGDPRIFAIGETI